MLLRSLAVLRLAAHIPQEEGTLVAGIPGGNLAVRQVEHTQVVAGNQPVLEVAGRPQVQDNQDLVGHLEHNVTFPQLTAITFYTCGYINPFQ